MEQYSVEDQIDRRRKDLTAGDFFAGIGAAAVWVLLTLKRSSPPCAGDLSGDPVALSPALRPSGLPRR
jgi:hypothetical protein